MPEQKQHRALLAVDDERARSALRGFFRARGDVAVRSCGGDIFEAIRDIRPCLVVLEQEDEDLRFEPLFRDFPGIPVISLVSPSIKLALETGTDRESAKNGAAEILTLPLDVSELAC